MSIKVSDSIRVGQQKPLEDKYFNELVPYTSTSQVNTLLPKAVRHIGLTVNIDGEEYWYKDGIEDYDLVFKSSQKTIEVTKPELDILISENKLEPNRLYKITGVELWCFSQHLIKAIYLKAITNNILESEGVGEFYTPKYNTSDSNLGIWKGELLANGMISSASYNIGDKVIWGNLFWENISGNVGTNIKEYYDENNDKYFTPKLQSWLSNDWTLTPPNDDESLYNVQFDKIKYDIENDYIIYREDRFGNKNELSYGGLISLFPDIFIVDDIDSTFIYYVNSIALFQWGRNANFNNNISESIVLNCNYRCYSFKDNSILEKSIIYENNFLNVKFEGNNFKNSVLVGNYLKTFGGIINNTLDGSQISSNRYYFEISNNKLINNSKINSNNDNNIIVNNKYTIIKDNILDNNCQINSNTFVEEGKDVDGTIKTIYGNELINNSTINNNTIKNGSRIFGHRLEYFSTINGNTLDTDSNIYNNQLIQNGKIDNNILTGHGRIYGNQLDRGSEITLCKLRISPATSYATTMKNNRLFTGKIQNVDFGDIVNPVGTNPNDPNFGGNGLSECIIENNSIIKDLTFPNTGNNDMKFVRLSGFSEFKNITINNSIKNVDFINTIFNETSDYSKLIEGNGYQTDGFTKTYIDGVLLQDRFDEKQDVLTEDNVGSFMDLELPTKLTPTSGDTVLGRDSVTGKAVEIPATSLGGSGSVDTSNLVPYTGANKDVNIASNYFESSAGFKKTGGDSTQYLMADGSTSTLPTDLIRGTGTTNSIPKFTSSGILGNSLIYDNGTNVGIGTTTLGARLDVKAQGALSTDIVFRVRNSADTQNFLVVNGAGDVYNRGAQGNQYNTFFGENVGRNSTGVENSAFGINTLYANTTGYSNSAFGSNALYANIAGVQNSAFGSNALISNISGNINSAFGFNTLYANTTGYSNSAFGSNALRANTTGAQNTAIGSNALYSNTEGSTNSAFGSSALANNTTGAQNTAIGSSAGKSIIGGSQNSTPNNSVFIGFGTTANANNETNQIVIGHSAIGNGSNSVTLGNDSITKTVLKGQVIMGSSTSIPTGVEGAIYYNSTTKKHYGFNGTSWNALY